MIEFLILGLSKQFAHTATGFGKPLHVCFTIFRRFLDT